MKIRYFSPISYQRQLIYAALDDFTPISALSDYAGGPFGDNSMEWRHAVVEFLCVNLACGLLKLNDYLGKPSIVDAKLVEGYLTNGDVSRGFNVDEIWNILYFVGTEKLTDNLARRNLLSWDAMDMEGNPDFLDFIKRSYASVKIS